MCIHSEVNFQIGVARKAVFALSCLVRGFPYGQQVLAQNGGLEVLRKVFDRGDFQSLPLQLKVSQNILQIFIYSYKYFYNFNTTERIA